MTIRPGIAVLAYRKALIDTLSALEELEAASGRFIDCFDEMDRLGIGDLGRDFVSAEDRAHLELGRLVAWDERSRKEEPDAA